jgi:hypothetical protein
MNSKTKRNIIKLLISAIFCVVFLIGSLLLQAISGDLITAGNEPHKVDDINGLLGAFGYFGSIFIIPLYVIALIFTILTIRYGFKLRNSIKNPSNNKLQVIVPNTTKENNQ